MQRILREVLRAETQAIAIYSAEVFWIRNPGRRDALQKIRAEEIEHQSEFETYAQVPRLIRACDRFSGLILGSLFALMPWRVLCFVQGWAENEAAKIYARAEKLLVEAGYELPAGLLGKLRAAANQEKEHSLFFKGPARFL